MKVKKVLKRIAVVLAVIILVLAVAAGSFFLLYKPTLVFDASSLTGNVTSGASGFLYGVAEDGVPSYNMVESIDISSVSTKTQGGLQHPIGEVGDVAGEIIAGGSCDYIIVYLQDMYDTWYYDHENIINMKKNGSYDWKEYIESVFFPLIEQTVEEIKASDYHNKIVYCLYNECDNAIWFGSWIEDSNNPDGGYCAFDDEGRQNFYEGWKLTYDYVKTLDSEALIGGPGNYEYNSEKMDGFLAYTSANNCNPDILIYHELDANRSIYDWQDHVNDLKSIEEKYSVLKDTPIVVTEYGIMEDNGNPNTMSKYIAVIENTKVYGNQAYWLLANNLCNTAADYNTPNSAWWVYRWYADMEGMTMDVKISDFLHADVGKAIKENRELRYKQFMGVGAITDNKDKINILVSGADYDGVVKVKNLNDTALYGKSVCVTMYAATYQGLSGQVYAPEVVKSYTTECKDTLNIDMDNMNSNTAYYIEVREASDNDTDFVNDNLYTRYEFEHGTLLGNAYTYDSAYATTGEVNGMVGGIENEGDGVEITVNVPKSAEYELKFIFGNSNDGATSNDRTYTYANMSIDGEKSVLAFENTVKSELTSSYATELWLEEGEHTIVFTHNTGTFVLDSLLVRVKDDSGKVFVLNDKDRTTDSITSYLAVAPYDGYFDIEADVNTEISVDGAPALTDDAGKATVFLRRGLNYIDIKSTSSELTVTESEFEAEQLSFDADNAIFTGSAKIKENEANNIKYIDGISSDGGTAVYTATISEGGTYKVTVTYSNNDENGVHDYNIDLVEDYITVDVNGTVQNIYCRNTCSWDTFTTVTFNIELQRGDNIITLYNDGSNKFNGNVSKAPHIAKIVISETQI